MQTVLTTDEVSPSERFDFWSDEISRAMPVSLAAHPGAAGPFHAKAISSQVGALQLSSMSAAPLRVRRTAALAARRQEDFYKINLQLSGTGLVEQDGSHGRLGPGDLAICDTSRPYSFTYESDFRALLVLLPRPMIPLRPDTLRGLTGQRIAAREGLGAIVSPFLSSLAEQGAKCDGPATARLVDGAVSLVTALMFERLDVAAPPTPHQAMTLRIRDYIERGLSDPDLSPDVIAEAHGISRRYLFKLFAAEQTTVAGWIRARRLEHCARELADPATKDHPVAMIAARWGLLDGRHFARVFKAAYGHTPRDYRRQALLGHVPGPMPVVIGDRLSAGE